MKYFKDITGIEEAKSRYRQLAKELHPDMGGSDEAFGQMQKEYELFLRDSRQCLSNEIRIDIKNVFASAFSMICDKLLEEQIEVERFKKKLEAIKNPTGKDINSFLNNICKTLKQ